MKDRGFRRRARTVACPKCGARPAEPCVGKNGPRISLHKERHRAGPSAAVEKARNAGIVIDQFYGTKEWRFLRYDALKRSGGHCECCGVRGGPDAQLHVDHIKPRLLFPELEMDPNNLQVLCKDCNLGKSARDDTDWREVA